MNQSKLSFSYLENHTIYWINIISHYHKCIKQCLLEPSNLFNLLRQVSINGLIAFGMTFVILTGIDLSVGSTLALSSAMIAILMVSGVDSIVALLIGCIFGAI